MGGEWGERVRDACCRNPLLFISADAGVHKFLISWTVMSNLLAYIMACISERQTWCRHQGNVFYWHKLWKIEITPIMSQLHVKTRTRNNCNSLFTRQRCSGGFLHWICPNTKRRFKAIGILARHLQCRYSQDHFFLKNIYRLKCTSEWFERDSSSFGKNYPLSFLTIVYYPSFIIRVSGSRLFCSLWPLCLMRSWRGKTKGQVYSSKTDHCLS